MPDCEAEQRITAGRALHLIEHPCVDPSVWDYLDEPTRTWWVDRAKPITDAVRKGTMNTTTINPATEAELAIRQALHELTLQRGNGVFNIPALRRILESGLRTEQVRVVKRPAAQSSGLLDLDDNGGH